MELFGDTRTVVAKRHALIAPDGHVPSAFPGWKGAVPYVIISPGMGAKLSQILVTFEEEENEVSMASDGHEHAVYVETGECEFELPEGEVTLGAGGYLFVPPETAFRFVGSLDARVTIFRKLYQPVEGVELPPVIHGDAAGVVGEPFLGNPRAMLKTLLPDDSRYDLAMNIFTYEAGATLPFVETHIMEHGLLMLEGQGVYRLEESYYPVMAGDAIWMAPYCPQWFVAMGDGPASYLYYKDVQRVP